MYVLPFFSLVSSLIEVLELLATVVMIVLTEHPAVVTVVSELSTVSEDKVALSVSLELVSGAAALVDVEDEIIFLLFILLLIILLLQLLLILFSVDLLACNLFLLLVVLYIPGAKT